MRVGPEWLVVAGKAGKKITILFMQYYFNERRFTTGPPDQKRRIRQAELIMHDSDPKSAAEERRDPAATRD